MESADVDSCDIPVPILSYTYEMPMSFANINFSPQNPSNFRIISTRHHHGHILPSSTLPKIISTLSQAQLVKKSPSFPETSSLAQKIWEMDVLMRRQENSATERIFIEVTKTVFKTFGMKVGQLSLQFLN